jgi:hypothetical protein
MKVSRALAEINEIDGTGVFWQVPGSVPDEMRAVLIEQLCARRAALVQAMAVNPEQITDDQIRDLAALQSAFAVVEAEHRRAERETLHEEVQQRTGSYA